jgi:pyrroline-5-carboxylate reductase
MLKTFNKISIIGCGNMGLIYAQLLKNNGLQDEKQVVLIAKNEEQKNRLNKVRIGVVELINSEVISESSLILLAVKPQDFSIVGQALKGRIKPDALVISIMAGINISTLQNSLSHQWIVRAMPNAPALYGKGITVFCNSIGLTSENLELAEQFLGLTGKTIKTSKEELLDSVTAISGSGPAYFFYLTLQMKNAAITLGMDEEMAETLVRETLIGSAEMVSKNQKMMSELINTIASKGGTTEAALNFFNLADFDQIILNGLEKATLRSKELAQNNQ